MGVFFTADTHFGHENVIPYCQRPYSSVDEMDEDLVKKWNETVGERDWIFHLGDFAFMDKLRTAAIIARLNGLKVLLKGNHDKRTVKFYLDAGFVQVYKLPYGASLPFWDTDEKGTATVAFEMSHFPFQHAMGDYDDRDYLTERAPTQGRLKGTVLVHGHVHDQWKLRPNMVNVGVDVWDLKPVSLEELLIRVRFVGNLPNGNEQ